jgi:hypothetical protein
MAFPARIALEYCRHAHAAKLWHFDKCLGSLMRCRVGIGQLL